MRLQDAILLGDTLKRSDPDKWLNADGSCGCAFGGALLAAGMTISEYAPMTGAEGHVVELPFVRRNWPWLTADMLIQISDRYRDVCDGLSTIEDVAAYVATIEPPEEPHTPQPEPAAEPVAA